MEVRVVVVVTPGFGCGVVGIGAGRHGGGLSGLLLWWRWRCVLLLIIVIFVIFDMLNVPARQQCPCVDVAHEELR
jgi:hypothetical protein